MRFRRRFLSWYIKFRYPEYRLDWVGKDVAMLICIDGRRWLIPDERKPWDWPEAAVWLILTNLWLGAAFVTIGTLLGYANVLLC